MDTTGNESTETTVVVQEPIRHQLGRTLVGSVAAFAANRLGERAYDKAVQLYRSRKSA